MKYNYTKIQKTMKKLIYFIKKPYINTKNIMLNFKNDKNILKTKFTNGRFNKYVGRKGQRNLRNQGEEGDER